MPYENLAEDCDFNGAYLWPVEFGSTLVIPLDIGRNKE